MIDPTLYRDALRNTDVFYINPRKLAIEYEKKFIQAGEKRCPKKRRIQEVKQVLAEAGCFYPELRSFTQLTNIELCALWFAIQDSPAGGPLHPGELQVSDQ